MGGKAATLALDTGNTASFADAVKATLADWNQDSFDNIVHSAGHAEYAPLRETTEAQFDGLIDVRVKGVLFLTQALLPVMADDGRIVTLSSGLTRFALPNFGA